jgi:hypothetical protein
MEISDPAHGLKADGCSVHPRRHCHQSPKALRAPWKVAGGVCIAMQTGRALGAVVPAHGAALLHDHAAA